MKAFRDRNPYMVGLASISAIAVLVGIAFAIGTLHLLEHTYNMRGVFADSGGIESGNDVRVAGVRVGRVTGVHADREAGNVIVTMVVNKGIHLGPDTHAEVALQTLLGTKFVRLTGPVVRPYLDEQPTAARIIPIEKTKTPFDVFELTKVATRNVEATDTAKLNELINQLADVTQGKHDQITTLLTSITQLSAAINGRDAQLRDLLDKADQLSGTLADKDQTLVALIDQSQGILNLIQRRRNDIAAGLTSGNKAVGEVAGLLDRNMASLNAALDSLHPILQTVSQHQADVDRALTVVGPGALGLAKAPAHGPWADVYVRAIGPDLAAIINSLGLPKP